MSSPASPLDIRRIVQSAVTKHSSLKDASNEVVWRLEEELLDWTDDLGEDRLREVLDRRTFRMYYKFLEDLYDEATIREARVNPNVFMEYVFQDDVTGDPLEQGEMHEEWQTVMGRYRQVLIVAPREHGKSTNIIGRVLWELGVNPNKRIKIVCNNDEKAKDRVLELQTHIETNARLHRVFPHLRPAAKSRWTTTKLFIQRTDGRIMRDPSIEGCGVLGSGTGGRCDILILDDVVDRKNALTQPGLREAVKEAVKSDWLALLSKEGWAVSICTLWHKKDLNHELGGDALRDFLRGRDVDQSGIESGQWYVSFRAVSEDFDPVWPEQWPRERLQEKYRQVGRSAFNRGWRNKATDDTETVIDTDWIGYYNPRKVPTVEDGLVLVQSYDLALSTKKDDRNSYFACVTFGIAITEEGPEVYIVDAYQTRINFPDQIKTVKSGYRRFKPAVILMESVYYQAALAQYLQATTLLPIIPCRPAVSKKLRLEGCSPQIEAGNVLFNPRMDPDSGHRLLSRGDVVTAITEFPFSDHDDLVDAFSQGLQYIQQYEHELVTMHSQGRQWGQPEDGRVFTIEA